MIRLLFKPLFFTFTLWALSTANLNAALSLSGDLAFGNVTVGLTGQSTLTITNAGEESVTVTNITFPAGFSGDWVSGTIAATQAQNVIVTFSPTNAASYGGDIIVESDADPGVNTIAASGTGVAGGGGAGPANDAFANAITLTGDETSTSGSNVDATKETGEPNHAGNAGGASVWWSWTATASGPIAISTAGSDFDTVLAIYTGDSLATLELVASNDDGPASPASLAVFNAVEGTTYQIAVDGFDGASGAIQLSIGAVPPQFTPLNATYNGLFYPAEDVAHENSGFFTAKTTTKAKFSAKLTLAGKRHSFSGTFSEDGTWTGIVNRKGASPLDVSLEIDLQGGDLLTGTVSDGVWTANLLADRAVFNKDNPAPQAGRYTFVLPGSGDSSVAPGGNGYGTVNVSSAGIVKFAGVLGDGTKVSQSVSLSPTGEWPFYVPLYSSTGSIIGWLQVDPEAESAVSGLLDWFKNPQSNAKYYPAGFVLQTLAFGSPYQFIKGSPVLDMTEGELLLDGGGLSEPIAHDVLLASNSKVTNLTDSKSKLKITTSSGVFKGKVLNPDTGKSVPVSGVILQNVNFGSGHFLGDSQTGLVYFGP